MTISLEENSFSVEWFEDVLITPYTELMDNPKGLSFHKGGPVWPKFWEQKKCRHNIGNSPVDSVPECGEINPENVLNETLAWCGPIVNHFGHQVADFMTRLLVYKTLGPNILFAFGVHPRSNINSIDQAPQWFHEILIWFDIDVTRCLVIREPTIVKRLVCAPQQEQVGGRMLEGLGPSSEYLRLIERTVPKLRLTNNIYYISRAAMQGKIAGEYYIENLMGSARVKVVRPETISLTEQLRIYSTAKLLIFSEGSALHSLQLLGKIHADVFVINRRSGNKLAFKNINPRVKSVRYFDIGEAVYGLNRAGKPCPELGICIPTSTLLLELLNALPISTKQINYEAFRIAIKDDLSKWHVNESNSPRASVPGSMELINNKLSSLSIKL